MRRFIEQAVQLTGGRGGCMAVLIHLYHFGADGRAVAESLLADPAMRGNAIWKLYSEITGGKPGDDLEAVALFLRENLYRIKPTMVN